MAFVNVLIYVSIFFGFFVTTFFIINFIRDRKIPRKLFSDNELPSLTVLIPAYNEERSIGRTIESIASSDYPAGKMKVIVVDDGSKDKTYEIAKRYIGTLNGKEIKVFSKENGGKGSALNFGISKSKTDYIFSMDADTFVEPDAVKKMVRYFKDSEVMSVTSAMVIYKPKRILEKIQQVEYLLGLFIRRASASINSIYITPGAFSAYRKSFFDKYGGYVGVEQDNLTEDIELAMRIQMNGYKIENAHDAVVYTIPPSHIGQLTKQRKRWYMGLTKNTWDYKNMFSKKYGDLGSFALPVAWLSIFFSVFFFIHFIVETAKGLIRELIFLGAVDYNILSYFRLAPKFIYTIFFTLFSDPRIIFMMIFLLSLFGYISYSKRKVKGLGGIGLWAILYSISFFLLFGFWWTVSLINVLLGRKAKWR